MRSHLLVGTVRHRRSKPIPYDLRHAVYYIALDLDEIDVVTARSRLIRRGRLGVLSFHDRDHLVPPSDDLRAGVRDHLRAEGLETEGWRITLITNLRVLGYVFDPASFYLCRDRDGELRALIVEVHNTHGERRLYTLRPERRGSAHVASMEKDFYVSPFIAMAARYTVRVQDEPTNVRIAIVEAERDGRVLVATLTLRRVPLTDRQLIRLLVRIPLVTYKTIVTIHLHAWRLWRRGVPFQRHSETVR